MTELDIIKEQHLKNYKEAVIQIVENNTKSLVEDDIMLLIKKPPLDSMDIIKSKFLTIAKREKLVVKTEDMEKILLDFRNKLDKDLKFIEKLRVKELTADISKFSPEKDYEIIKITKKQLNDINKKVNSEAKKIISSDVETLLISKISKIYGVDENNQKKLFGEISKFLKSTYQKQLLENINFKILVKDTTLINGVREQGERYIFTKNNSRLNKLD